MSGPPSTPRPPTPAGFDPTRAAERAADPRGWRFEDDAIRAVYDVIAERRDIRKFRPDPVPDDVLDRVLGAAHRAPSVGLMQPWRFIVVRSADVRGEVRRLAQRERLRQADRFDERARPFLDQKIEGIVEAPLGVVVCCDHGDDQIEVLGRGTIPETDVYSTACAIQNLWLAARAEGLGIGWVSFYRPPDLRALLRIPERVSPMAYLCLGWPDERPVRPGLEASGWSARTDASAVVMQERWEERAEATPIALRPRPASRAVPADAAPRPDRDAAIAARDRADRLVRPAGSLGALDTALERWASMTGAPPRPGLRAGVLVAAAAHGHTARGTSLFPSEVSSQVAAAAARGETAVAVLAQQGGHALRILDVGLDGPTPPGAVDRKVRAGTADLLDGPAMSPEEHAAAARAGAELVDELIDGERIDLLIPGEIGIGNTTTAAILAAALLQVPQTDAMVGRGAGADAAGLDRKRAVVEAALDHHREAVDSRDSDTILAALGGLEFSALAGAITAAARRRIPVLLDGYATGIAALAAVRREPWIAEFLLAGHRSAEPGHGAVLTELGLEPLLDLRLRLGEASGALLALPLLQSVGALHHGMATFAEAGISGPQVGGASPATGASDPAAAVVADPASTVR
ncbi:MAG: nicotinate-nucleotide--dimethylbenzimidazole phosphoribosyltransferase [Solirubrobacteraceae bacterium]|nr:nicotinate-nucleotide--dimethylbenzimidazole phosphoribosyltransferase [Solirubrobacteraceae bacterium]